MKYVGSPIRRNESHQKLSKSGEAIFARLSFKNKSELLRLRRNNRFNILCCEDGSATWSLILSGFKLTSYFLWWPGKSVLLLRSQVRCFKAGTGHSSTLALSTLTVSLVRNQFKLVRLTLSPFCIRSSIFTHFTVFLFFFRELICSPFEPTASCLIFGNERNHNSLEIWKHGGRSTWPGGIPETRYHIEIDWYDSNLRCFVIEAFKWYQTSCWSHAASLLWSPMQRKF